MRNKDNREHSGADRLNEVRSRPVRERALSVRNCTRYSCMVPERGTRNNSGFNAGGTAGKCKISVPEYRHVFRDFFSAQTRAEEICRRVHGKKPVTHTAKKEDYHGLFNRSKTKRNIGDQ